MKVKILLLAILLPLFSAAQSTFKISGKIGTIGKPAMVYLDYQDAGTGMGREDSSVVVNGNFVFSGTLSDVATARMVIAHQGQGKNDAIFKGTADAIYIYFGSEQITITSGDSLSNAVFSGSKVYSEYQAYNKAIGGYFIDLIKAANAAFARGTPEQQKDTAYISEQRKAYNHVWATRAENQLAYAKAHPNSFFSLVALSESASYRLDTLRMVPVYEALNGKLKSTDLGLKTEQRLRSATITSAGNAAPLFTQNNAGGKPVSLASLKGKVVLLDFWASWCEPCRAESPNLKKQYELYKSKGFEIISVSVDNVKSRWLGAIKEDQLPWLQVSDLKGWNNAVARLYGITGVPAFFLLDRQGRIIDKDLRGEALNKKLAEIFN
ncbi:MAG: AhpC/TSA family protein [Bacteroidota bacterium]|nr:AhpC/TSA family protein [Bacteroidota bacterium]